MRSHLIILAVVMLCEVAGAANPSASAGVNCTLGIQTNIVVSCDASQSVTVSDGGQGGAASLVVSVTVSTNTPVTVATGLTALPGGLSGVTQTATRSSSLTGTLGRGATTGFVTVQWSGLSLHVSPATYTNTLTITVSPT